MPRLAEHDESRQWESQLLDIDAYGSRFTAFYESTPYRNAVAVVSPGHDRQLSTDDDIGWADTDLHVRRLVGREVEEQSQHLGRGLMSGLIQGAKQEGKNLLGDER
ncbi:hypothetical protein LCGC14_2506670 [marine sediment metagenome]|uniref:Uncharacterized protein n=1 Tax=marine sediment metagenome TaxID=412755 RepID=A0A0F9BND1_9ZZZZ